MIQECLSITKRLFLLLLVTGTLLESCQPGPAISANYHKCLPPAYTSLQTSTMVARASALSSTTDPIERVSETYIQFLKPDPWMEHTRDNLWSFTPIGQGYLFQCYNTPSDLESEFGCILLTANSSGTSIERMWDTSEGGISCISLLHRSIERDLKRSSN